MASITLTAAATQAAQSLGVIDPGEGLSTQQIADALSAANNLLENWYNEQAQALRVLMTDQGKALQAYVDELAKAAAPLATAYTLAGGTYTAATAVPPFVLLGTVPQFADSTTPITVPAGYPRAITLALALELAPQYDVEPTPALVKSAAEARAAATPSLKTPPVTE